MKSADSLLSKKRGNKIPYIGVTNRRQDADSPWNVRKLIESVAVLLFRLRFVDNENHSGRIKYIVPFQAFIPSVKGKGFFAVE